jgi:hypothetical protein
LEGFEGLRTETWLFVCLAGDLEDMAKKINEYLRDKTNANISYHNVQGKDFTYVIATVTSTPYR